MNPAAPPSPIRPRRRWLRWLLMALLVLVGLPAGYFFITSWTLRRAVDNAIAETDRLDPRWRYADMEADSKTYPDADNSAPHIVKVRALIGRRGAPSAHKDYGPIFDDLPTAAQLNPQQIALLQECFEQIPEALAEARKLKDMPHGRFAVRWDSSGLWALLPDHQEARTVVDLLRHDALFRVQFGDPDAALESCRAQLNVARVLADDVFLISYLIRIGCDFELVATLERVLAQGQGRDASLKHLQALLGEEHRDLLRQWIVALRGERAEFHRFYEPLVLGTKRWLEIAESLRLRIGWEDYVSQLLPMRLTQDYPKHLRLRNEMIAAARLPLHEQLERFAELEKKVDRSDRRMQDLSQVLPLLPPEMPRLAARHLHSQALLRAAEAGLACERYRLAHQAWPDSLAAVVTAGLLDAVPVDPFDGQPLRLARRKDGITIYAVGADRQDNAGHIEHNRPAEKGVDFGFRLWDPAQRRQAPRPPAAAP